MRAGARLAAETQQRSDGGLRAAPRHGVGAVRCGVCSQEAPKLLEKGYDVAPGEVVSVQAELLPEIKDLLFTRVWSPASARSSTAIRCVKRHVQFVLADGDDYTDGFTGFVAAIDALVNPWFISVVELTFFGANSNAYHRCPFGMYWLQVSAGRRLDRIATGVQIQQ